jgi:hypothetical protein
MMSSLRLTHEAHAVLLLEHISLRLTQQLPLALDAQVSAQKRVAVSSTH